MRVFFMGWIFKALSSTVYLSLTSWSFPILATAASIATAIGFNLTCIQPQHNFQKKVRNLPSCLSLRSCMGLEAMGSLNAKKNDYFIYKLKSLASLKYINFPSKSVYGSKT